MPITSTNPATGETIKTFEALTDEAIDQKLQLAESTFRQYRKTTFSQRATWLVTAAEILEAEKEHHGRLMTQEMGKPLKSAIEEAAKCALGCRYYAENAARFLADEPVPTSATLSYIRYRPIGAVLAVMPWNFPYWQVFRFAAPALMAGNVGLLKHASNVPQCALAIEDVLRRAGFPDGAFQTLLIGSEQVHRVIDDPRVRAVTLTGSEEAGSRVAEWAGRQIKKSVLELGGSDPFIVMPSADLDRAIETAVKARCINNGQSCIAAKRFIVAEGIADEFERRLAEGMERMVVGDPMDAATDVGPLATKDVLNTLKQQVEEAVQAGARLVCGGRRLDRPGNYYAPTVLADLPAHSSVYRQELFGPVALLFRVRDLDAAIRLANDSHFGLGSSVWTNDAAEEDRFIEEIDVGMVFVNAMVASDPRMPFGGVKRSGYGRELSIQGIREFVNIKSVWIDKGHGSRRADTE
jgi:succinate-semialdehyde dehydrogenase / glutarate-semialdehyde dehydrogenase